MKKNLFILNKNNLHKYYKKIDKQFILLKKLNKLTEDEK